jgi:hypothetical protein
MNQRLQDLSEQSIIDAIEAGYGAPSLSVMRVP